jgi:hypothetical protein
MLGQLVQSLGRAPNGGEAEGEITILNNPKKSRKGTPLTTDNFLSNTRGN